MAMATRTPLDYLRWLVRRRANQLVGQAGYTEDDRLDLEHELLLDAPMQSRSFDFHLEALAYVYRAGFEIREVGITYQFSNSSLRPEIITEALRTCARLWREDFKVST